MSSREEHSELRFHAVLALAVERLAAEVAGRLAAAGIESLVLKGPVLARWLYPAEIRPFGDADLLVSPASWDAAVDLLQQAGFADALGPMAHPRMESLASTAFVRGADNLDLHSTLHGLEAPPEAVWAAFSASDERQEIGGAALRIPSRSALALHAGLHAAHHAEGKALEDLRRAIAVADGGTWEGALRLARELDGLPSFASGLRLLPEGVELALRLEIPDEVRSTRHQIRFENVPMAEGIDALLRPGLGWRRRARVVLEELLPRPEFMCWWTPLARRGRLGLLASYPWRWLLFALHAPRGLLTVLRARRAGRGRG